MIGLHIIEIALQGIRDSEHYECCERIIKAARDVNAAETLCRRAKVSELIQARASLEISLDQLENSYNELKAKHGKVEAIEKIIREQKLAVVRSSYDKAKLKKSVR